MKARPVGVTILAILAGIAAVLAAIHALQFLGILPFFIGSSGYKVHAFSFWYALMYGLLVWVYIWLRMALWRVDPGAWMFLVIVTMFYLILDFFSLFGATSWDDVAVSVILNAAQGFAAILGLRLFFGGEQEVKLRSWSQQCPPATIAQE
jgi:hypothetical protein